jgi:hypothetical protein
MRHLARLLIEGQQNLIENKHVFASYSLITLATGRYYKATESVMLRYMAEVFKLKGGARSTTEFDCVNLSLL